jgi:hypothetical protein
MRESKQKCGNFTVIAGNLEGLQCCHSCKTLLYIALFHNYSVTIYRMIQGHTGQT